MPPSSLARLGGRTEQAAADADMTRARHRGRYPSAEGKTAPSGSNRRQDYTHVVFHYLTHFLASASRLPGKCVPLGI